MRVAFHIITDVGEAICVQGKQIFRVNSVKKVEREKCLQHPIDINSDKSRA